MPLSLDCFVAIECEKLSDNNSLHSISAVNPLVAGVGERSPKRKRDNEMEDNDKPNKKHIAQLSPTCKLLIDLTESSNSNSPVMKKNVNFTPIILEWFCDTKCNTKYVASKSYREVFDTLAQEEQANIKNLADMRVVPF